ncbi:hypothetical protein N1851_014636 [Merluccius polli]|uniref:Uncharacterized protein n=1 Tax=Merluccius polli TaxID=89951 RepID=A0AA47MTX2_MERPO|nr:hypothetical protein N1851_014636 [Merluccius polli]
MTGQGVSQQVDEGAFTLAGTDEDTKLFVRWRVANIGMFSGGRTTNPLGYKKFLEERGLVGRVSTTYLKKKWENLKQKYKDLKDPPTGLSTEGGKATAASWKWFDLMHEAIGDRPSVTPPVVIATCAQGAVVITPPLYYYPTKGKCSRASTSSRASTPKKRRVDVAEALQELRRQDEQEWRTIHQEEKEREDRREAEQARQAAEREENEQRRYREISRDGAWRCCLPSWILLPCCSIHAVLGVQHVSLAQANVVEDGAAEDDLRDEQDVHLQRLQKYGPPPGLQHPEGPLHHSSGFCQPAIEGSLQLVPERPAIGGHQGYGVGEAGVPTITNEAVPWWRVLLL